jgi:hypothetical protein
VGVVGSSFGCRRARHNVVGEEQRLDEEEWIAGMLGGMYRDEEVRSRI